MADASLPFRNQVRASLHRHPDLRLIAEADTGAAALHLFHKFRPDVALVDVSLPDRSGFEIVGCLRQADPDCKLLVLSHAPDALVRMAAIWAGADHVFDKGGGLSGIIEFLRQTLEQRG